MKKKINIIYYYTFLIIYLELFFKIFSFSKVGWNFLYALLFSIPLIFILKILSNIFSEKANKVITIILSLLITLYYFGNYIFKVLFSTVFSIYTLQLANQAVDFFSVIVSTVINHWYVLLIMFVPFVLLIIFLKHFKISKTKAVNKLIYIGLVFVFYGFGLLSLLVNKNDMYSAYQMYYKVNDTTVSASTLGLFTTARLDIKRAIFGFDESNLFLDIKDPEKEEKPKEEEVKYNKLDIDFDTLIANETDSSIKNMHLFFQSEEATKHNKYTGMFKGKNLVFIVAEGFNEIAVKENITPTLYKLVNSGFVFKNYYTPEFLSTTGGEYQANMGSLPSQGTLSNFYKGTNYYPYAMGNVFTKENYYVSAYHNWTYTYYHRDKSYPTLGYNNYLGCRGGLEEYMNCKSWPTSDLDMITVTTPMYTDKTPFMTYYLTLSGHTHYNWGGNNMAYKNKALVKDLDYSETAKAYLATQIELDKALEKLLQDLEAKGILKDTVIALVGDHHPYNMATGVSEDKDIDIINELSDRELDKDTIVEVNRSNFILWNSEMETTEVTKVANQIDVLPTILNLFGIEYDSRLIIGKDILSEAEGIAIMSNRSWVSDSGTYFSSSKKFVPKDGVTVEEGYVDRINKIVANRFTMSGLLSSKNYYKIVLGE